MGELLVAFLASVVGYQLKRWVGDEITEFIYKPLFGWLHRWWRSPRISGIRRHELERIRGRGHQTADPTRCNEAACTSVFV